MSSSDSEPEEVSMATAALGATARAEREKEGRKQMTKKRRGKRTKEDSVKEGAPAMPSAEEVKLDEDALEILAADHDETDNDSMPVEEEQVSASRKRIRIEPVRKKKNVLVSVAGLSGIAADVGVDKSVKAFAESLFKNPKHERVRATLAGAKKGTKAGKSSRLFSRK